MVPVLNSALIVGAGEGLGASLARVFTAAGMRVAISARNAGKLAKLAEETGALPVSCDASSEQDVSALFETVAASFGAPSDIVVYNASARLRGAFPDLRAEDVSQAMAVTAFGGFLVAREAARAMLKQSKGAILFTGASASVKGYARSAPFAMGKFALRGLAQSLARELGPQGIHVAHIVIDGAIRPPGRENAGDRPDGMLDADAIARTYLDVIRQDRSAWTFEVDLRPWLENF